MPNESSNPFDTTLVEVKTKLIALTDSVKEVRDNTSQFNTFKEDFAAFKANTESFKGTIVWWGKFLPSASITLGLATLGLIGSAIWVATSINGLQGSSSRLETALTKDEQRLESFGKDTQELKQTTAALPKTVQAFQDSVSKLTDSNSNLSNAENQHAADLKQIKEELDGAVAKINAFSSGAGSERAGQQTIRVFFKKEDFKGTGGNSAVLETQLPNAVSESEAYRSTVSVQWLENIPSEIGPWQASAELTKDGTGCRIRIFSPNPILKDFLSSHGVSGVLSISIR